MGNAQAVAKKFPVFGRDRIFVIVFSHQKIVKFGLPHLLINFV